MTDEHDKPEGTDEKQASEKRASDELREGLAHLFSAARKVMKSAEPTVTTALDDAERVIEKIGRGGTAVATEVGKEVATLATRLADRLKTVAGRENPPDERTPPDPGGDDRPRKP